MSEPALDNDGPHGDGLSPTECLQLLAGVPVGRLVFTVGGLPAIRLVRFTLHGEIVGFSTDDPDEYRAAERGDVVAFEADDLDAEGRATWTVTAIGRLDLVHGVPPAPTVRLAIEEIHGQRISTG